jgi:hypothetical protein
MNQEQESPSLMNRSRSVSFRETACGEKVKLWGACQYYIFPKRENADEAHEAHTLNPCIERVSDR